MKNKLLLCASLIALSAAILTGCQKKEDLFAIESQIAQNTMKGYYVFIKVDSAAVNTTLYEWNLAEDEARQRTGYLRESSTGNGLDGDVITSLTWAEATMAKDGLSMSVPVKVGDKDMTLVWQDGVLVTQDYTTTKTLISMASILRTINESFVNKDFVYNDTTHYITVEYDTIPYLAWKTEVVNFTAQEIEDYKAYLQTMLDTLHWFNETYPSRAVPDTVRFSPKQQPDGTYKGQISRAYEDQEIDEIETNHGPLHIINSEMVFNRDGQMANTGSFLYHEQTWTEEFYDDPTSQAAMHEDSILQVTDAKWTPTAITNVKKFVVTYKGHLQMSKNSTIGGEPQQPISKDETNYFFDVQLSGYNAQDGEVTYNERKYKIK